jgi:two-component system, LytTR family, sensor kinase
MKTILTFLTFFLIFCTCLAQEKRPVKWEDGEVKGEVINYGVSSLNSKFQIFLEPDENTKSISPFNHIPNDPLGTIVFLEGATTVSVTTRVHKDSLKYYRYSIIENDTVVKVSNHLLSKVDFVWNDRSDLPGYLTMNFGIGNIVGKKITLKVYRLTDESKVTTIIIYNKILKPAELLEKMLVAEGRRRKSTNSYFPNLTPLKNGITIVANEKYLRLYFSLKKTDLDFAYRIYLTYKDNDEERIVYQSNDWSYNTVNGNPGASIEYNYFKQPGDYEVIISPVKQTLDQLKGGGPQLTKISFKVLPAPMAYSFEELLVVIVIIVLLGGAIAFTSIYLIRKKNKDRLMVANLQADAAKSELNMVRSQLNPHFVFNALSGIQSLMNKNEIERANNYLNKFAALTRHVLDDSTTISVRDEIILLDDYLSMEQLRFSFKYAIKADEDVNQNLEIPVMLAQPFVENAVKHGVIVLKERGEITVNFTKQDKNLVISVTDNGGGFDVNKNHAGLGLKLSKKRIDLLNQTYKECPIMLQIKSSGGKTIVTITLTQWL